MEPVREKELVSAAQGGDLGAFGELVAGCRDSILSELTGLLGCSHDAEDILQDAILRGYLKLSTLQEPYSFGGWIRQIARNMARNRLSRRRIHVPLEEHLTEALNRGGGYCRDERDPMEVPALVALSRLSSRLRETARLTYLSSCPQKNVAHRLGIPLGTVKRRLWEGRDRMKKEVLEMSELQSDSRSGNLVPDIFVEELPGETMTVQTLGPGLYFGTVLEEGHEEVCSFYDYPGGILTQVVVTQVVREVEIMGRHCFEVLVRHSECQPPEPNVLDYFHADKEGFHWLMRVVADAEFPSTRFMEEGEELFPRSYCSGEYSDYVARVVELTIGNRKFGACLAVFWGWEQGTPAESFFTADGRQVLHRRYVGPDAAESRNYRYDNLLQEERRVFRGTDYRLWYDTVLSE